MEPNFPGMQALRNENDCSNSSCKICFRLKVMAEETAFVSQAIPFNELSLNTLNSMHSLGFLFCKLVHFVQFSWSPQLLFPPHTTHCIRLLCNFLLYSSSPATTPFLSFQESLQFLPGHESFSSRVPFSFFSLLMDFLGRQHLLPCENVNTCRFLPKSPNIS